MVFGFGSFVCLFGMFNRSLSRIVGFAASAEFPDRQFTPDSPLYGHLGPQCYICYNLMFVTTGAHHYHPRAEGTQVWLLVSRVLQA